MFGEGLGGVTNGQRDNYWSWAGSGALGVKFGLAPGGASNPGSSGANLVGGWNYFSSRHPGPVIMFSFGDGSVRGLRVGSTGLRNPIGVGTVLPGGSPDGAMQQSDWAVLQQLGGMADGFSGDVNKIAQ